MPHHTLSICILLSAVAQYLELSHSTPVFEPQSSATRALHSSVQCASPIDSGGEGFLFCATAESVSGRGTPRFASVTASQAGPSLETTTLTASHLLPVISLALAR
jgi:hypothetical protein